MTYGHQTLAGHGFPFLVLRPAASHVHCDEMCTFQVGGSEPADMRRAKRMFQGDVLGLIALSDAGYETRTQPVSAV